MENFLHGAIIFTLFLSLNTNLSIAATHTDIAALVKFKNSIEKDDKGVLREWDSQHEACFWSGVSCTEWRVTGLDLSGSGLVGVIPLSAISSLDHLQTLNLSNNSLYGNLSMSPQFPFTLEKLDLSHNSLSGFISEEVFLHPNLESIYLSHNNLSGILPRNLLSSDHIHELDLSSNNFTGFIKLDEFSSCESLTKLDLSANHFSGKIPSEISKCSHLKTLNISNNELINSIPKSFGELQSLEVLDISYNHLTGVLPQELGNSCSTLQELSVSTNNISGSFPLSFSECSSLSVLDISNNKISGDFPDSVLENLSSLENLLVSNNFFSGTFPLSVSSCSKLKIVDFSSNQLQGSLPDTICPGASALEELRLADNNITGTIPSTLSQCPALRTIDLSINRVSGIIPPELGSLKNLERLMMWFNQLEGPIPAELGKCRQLKDLILNNNDLSGSIPKTLSRCTEMEWIALSSNKLSGSIPRDFGNFKRLSILQLANNSLSGEIPREMGNCSSLLWLDLNNNKLTGTIPKRLGRQTGAQPLSGILSGNTLAFLRNVGNACQGVGGLLEFAGITPDRLLKVPVLKDCQFTRLYSGTALNDWTHYESLEYLDLSYNSLTGPIPDELGDMQAMQVLELAHNNLTGELPFSLGRLKNLGVFEASHNHLQGQIPQSFSNLTFLVQIDFSHNNLTGEIPERGQLSTLPASQYAGNPGLCGVPLPPCGASPAAMGNPVADEPPRSKPAQFASLANSVVLGSMLAMAVACAVAVWVIATRARRREADAILKTLHTSCNTTTWKLGREKEPLSINVATFERPLRKLTFSQLIEATNGFCANSMVGSGGFGEVFKATLKDGSTVAIKKLIRLSCQGDREFMAEMETLGKIKHRNLVPLLGYCKVGEERLLVYEYMQYGSLDDMLHGEGETGKTKKSMLTWEVRKQIARGAAKGLAFLHHNCIPHIIHRDMKSSNVLLDRNMEARVSDFGMARLISALDTHLTISALAGTPGYVPPEYYQSIRCTAKGDVYSFGVMMLELVTGRRPTDKEAFGDSNLVGWARMHVSQGRASEIVDPAVKEEVGDVNGDVLKHLSIGLQCLEDFPSRRPNMLQVVSMFKELHAHFLPDGGSQLSLPTNVVVIN